MPPQQCSRSAFPICTRPLDIQVMLASGMDAGMDDDFKRIDALLATL
jgi:hypothetical protein